MSLPHNTHLPLDDDTTLINWYTSNTFIKLDNSYLNTSDNNCDSLSRIVDIERNDILALNFNKLISSLLVVDDDDYRGRIRGAISGFSGELGALDGNGRVGFSEKVGDDVDGGINRGSGGFVGSNDNNGVRVSGLGERGVNSGYTNLSGAPGVSCNNGRGGDNGNLAGFNGGSGFLFGGIAEGGNMLRVAGFGDNGLRSSDFNSGNNSLLRLSTDRNKKNYPLNALGLSGNINRERSDHLLSLLRLSDNSNENCNSLKLRANENNNNPVNRLRLSDNNAKINTNPFRSTVINIEDKKTLNLAASTKYPLKLLILSNINILNIIGLDKNSQYLNTLSLKEAVSPSTESTLETKVEKPLLRIKFTRNITSMFTNFPLLILGFDNSDVILMDIENFDYTLLKLDLNSAVTCIDLIYHPCYPYVVLVGLANGEVLILNPSASNQSPGISRGSEQTRAGSSSSNQSFNYIKKVEGKDSKSIFFKKFDLSIFNKSDTSDDLIIGHFKISHKPITSFATTIPFNNRTRDSFTLDHLSPMIIAISLSDGFVKIIDLMFTYDKNYALDDVQNISIITDIISNYFNDGINSIRFSPDFKFLAVVGSGDIIEIFKMSYYNVNGLLKKKDDNSSQNNIGGNYSQSNFRRSRSDTVNSVSSSRGIGKVLPPLIKDIKIVGRFKGHTNWVYDIKFIPGCSYKFISCGFDGKVKIWEFDSRALPKVKINKPPIQKEQENRRRRSIQHRKQPSLISAYRSPSPVPKKATIPTNTGMFVQASLTYTDDNGHLNPSQSMNTVLSGNSNSENSKENFNSKNEVIFSIYKSLLDLRVKRHYKNSSVKENLLIHPVVDDKLVPSIETPLLGLDLSAYIKDGKVDGFHLEDNFFWCFSKSGDIFRYEITKA